MGIEVRARNSFSRRLFLACFGVGFSSSTVVEDIGFRGDTDLAGESCEDILDEWDCRKSLFGRSLCW